MARKKKDWSAETILLRACPWPREPVIEIKPWKPVPRDEPREAREKRLEGYMLFLAEQIDKGKPRLKVLLDRVEAMYLESKNHRPEVDRINELIARHRSE